MLFNITYTNKDDIAKINTMVGKPIGFLKSLKLGGIGSNRMIIDNVSNTFKFIKTKVSDLNYGSIEIRPKGIIIFITSQLNRFCWVIPYYKLTIFSGDFFSIYSDNNFIRFRKDNKYSQNKKFINKILNLKSTLTKNYFL